MSSCWTCRRRRLCLGEVGLLWEGCRCVEAMRTYDEDLGECQYSAPSAILSGGCPYRLYAWASRCPCSSRLCCQSLARAGNQARRVGDDHREVVCRATWIDHACCPCPFQTSLHLCPCICPYRHSSLWTWTGSAVCRRGRRRGHRRTVCGRGPGCDRPCILSLLLLCVRTDGPFLVGAGRRRVSRIGLPWWEV